MTTDRRFIRPGIERVTTDRHGRWYEWDGQKYWSVTTMLGQAMSKWPLVEWSAKHTTLFAIENHDAIGQMLREGLNEEAYKYLRGAANRYRDERADIGTTFHDYAEAHVLGSPKPTVIGEVAEMLDQFADWIDTMQPRFIMAEAPVFSTKEQYAGTLDAIVELPLSLFSPEALGTLWGVEALTAAAAVKVGFYPQGIAAETELMEPIRDTLTLAIDYKTGRGIYDDTALQLSAYRHAEYVGMPDGTLEPLPRLDGAAVLQVRATTDEAPAFWSLYPVRTDTEVWRSFLYAREMFRWYREIAGTVIGKPISAPAEATTCT